MVCPSTIAGGVAAAAVAPRFAVYFDQYHTTVLPNKTETAGVTHVITAFANSSLFTTDPVGVYEPFMPLSDIRPLFDNGTKVCMAIGGWGDTAGFRVGLASEESRALYAKNIATTLDNLGYDCVDVDYEYPAGNGYDYRQVPNEQLVSEIETFPKLLTAIKAEIGSKELSIAVPGLERDLLAFTAESVPLIDAAVDHVNVMSYDLINRRDTVTKHHTDIKGSLNAIDLYISRGLTPAKISLGIAFYAKYFNLPANSTCTGPLDCPILAAEDANGDDTGTSGAVTFEASSLPVIVDTSSLTTSPDASCGGVTGFTCNGTPGTCCSQYGFCGDTEAHCAVGCQVGFGDGCTAPTTKTTAQSFEDALANGQTDVESGAQWWIDAELGRFWTWDTAELISQKFVDILDARGLGGIFAWSLAEDSYDWSHLKAMQAGVAERTAKAAASKKHRRRRQY